MAADITATTEVPETAKGPEDAPGLFACALLDHPRKIDYERRLIFPREAMPDTLPDRLCTNPKSPYYDEKLLEKGVGIKFNGA